MYTDPDFIRHALAYADNEISLHSKKNREHYFNHLNRIYKLAQTKHDKISVINKALYCIKKNINTNHDYWESEKATWLSRKKSCATMSLFQPKSATLSSTMTAVISDEELAQSSFGIKR